MWFYLISYILIIGYELNASIAYAVKEKVLKNDNEDKEDSIKISRTAGNKSVYRRWRRILSRIMILIRRIGRKRKQ